MARVSYQSGLHVAARYHWPNQGGLPVAPRVYWPNQGGLPEALAFIGRIEGGLRPITVLVAHSSCNFIKYV